MSRRGRNGSAMVEFAIALPLLLAILTATMDYGWFFLQRSAVLNAAKDSARLAVAAPADTDPTDLAREHMESIMDAANIPCGTDCTLDATLVDVSGTLALTLSVSRIFEPLAGLVPLPDQTSAKVTMYMEHQDPAYYGL